MTALLELRWEFTPATLFEEALAYDFEQCKIAVDQGVLIATLPLVADDTMSNLRKVVESHVECLFFGAQVAARASCELRRPPWSGRGGVAKRFGSRVVRGKKPFGRVILPPKNVLHS